MCFSVGAWLHCLRVPCPYLTTRGRRQQYALDDSTLTRVWTRGNTLLRTALHRCACLTTCYAYHGLSPGLKVQVHTDWPLELATCSPACPATLPHHHHHPTTPPRAPFLPYTPRLHTPHASAPGFAVGVYATTPYLLTTRCFAHGGTSSSSSTYPHFIRLRIPAAGLPMQCHPCLSTPPAPTYFDHTASLQPSGRLPFQLLH